MPRPTTPSVAMPVANTEYSFIIPNRVKSVFFKLRIDGALMKWAWKADDIAAGDYVSLGGGFQEIKEGELFNRTLFFTSDQTSDTMEFQLFY